MSRQIYNNHLTNKWKDYNTVLCTIRIFFILSNTVRNEINAPLYISSSLLENKTKRKKPIISYLHYIHACLYFVNNGFQILWPKHTALVKTTAVRLHPHYLTTAVPRRLSCDTNYSGLHNVTCWGSYADRKSWRNTMSAGRELWIWTWPWDCVA